MELLLMGQAEEPQLCRTGMLVTCIHMAHSDHQALWPGPVAHPLWEAEMEVLTKDMAMEATQHTPDMALLMLQDHTLSAFLTR